MKAVKILSAILLMMIGTSACDKEQITPENLVAEQASLLKGAISKGKSQMVNKATGSVELIWKGASKGGVKGNKPDNLRVFFDLNAHEGNDFKAPKGELVYTVFEADASLHREIKAKVYDVHINKEDRRAWILATVISDSKGCSGGEGGHDSNCSSAEHDDSGGGCSHDDSGGDDPTHDEGGCSHDTGGDDATHDEGCTHEDTGEDDGGGCSGEDDHGGGTGGSPGGEGKGNPMSGKNCRLGQILALKVHDVGTPGRNGDGITWKWFSPDALTAPSIYNIADWPHLCKKTIIAGNIVVQI